MTKINWYNGKTANSASDMQKLCDTVNRSLLTPVSAPADTKVVAVDNTNSQKMLTIGDGLSIENDILKASGGKLYQHNLFLSGTSGEFIISIITKNNDIFTVDTLSTYIQENYGSGINKHGIQLSGFIFNTNNILNIPYELFYNASLYVRYIRNTISIYNSNINIISGTDTLNLIDITLTDTVIEL